VLGARTDFNGRSQKFVSVVKKDGVKIGTLNRSLTRSGGELEVYQAALFLDDSVQGSGVGSWMINRQFEMYEQLGVSVVDIAPAEVGRYYWAKVGYKMSDESKASYLEHFDEFSPKWGLSATKRKELRALFEADPTAFARSRDLPTVEYTDFDGQSHRAPVSKALFLDRSAPDWKGYLEPGTKEWREAREQLAAAAARPAKRAAEKRAAEEAAAEAEKVAAAKRAAEKRAAEEAAAAAVVEVGERGTRVKVGRLVQDDFESALRGVQLSPDAVKAAIEPPPGHDLYITGVFESNGRAEVMAKIYKGDREIGTLQRTFRRSGEELTVNQDAMFLDRAAQGTGTGTWMLNRQFDQYERMGVATVDIHAAEVGRYYWTKVGYRMTYSSQRNYLEHFDEVAPNWGIGDEQVADLRAMFERDPTEFARQRDLPEVTYTDQNGREARAPLNKALFLDKKSPTWYGSLDVGTPEWDRAREFLGSK